MTENHTLKLTANGPIVDSPIVDGKVISNCNKLVLTLEVGKLPELKLSLAVWDGLDIDLNNINISEVVRNVTNTVYVEVPKAAEAPANPGDIAF